VSADTRQTPTDRTILATIAIARWAIWVWLAVVAILQRKDLARPIVAVVAVVASLVWTAGDTVLLRRRPTALVHPLFVALEALVAWSVLILDGWVFKPGHAFGPGQNLAGNWPLVAAIASAIALGPWWGAFVGVFASTGRFFGGLANGVTEFPADRVLSLISSAVFYAVAGVMFGALTRRLRLVESEVTLRRARDEVARKLHDGVLQTLALVDRRTRTSDPELASEARASDRELRAWLFHGVRSSEEGGTLEVRLRRVADRVGRANDLAISISVIDDDDAPSASDEVLTALAAATGEALTNVAKHANASRAVVFAEVDDDGIIFVSVRDDGRGFDPTATGDRRGISDSIRARLQEVGARAEVTSALGTGTEVKMWSR
jgi:signal transduction histidine kinase